MKALDKSIQIERHCPFAFTVRGDEAADPGEETIQLRRNSSTHR
jgi:hypothetical protein